PRAALMRAGTGPSAFWTCADSFVASSGVCSIIAARSSSWLIARVQDAQALERKQLVGRFDRLGLGRDQRGEPAGRDAARREVDLGADPLDERVDHAGVAVDQAGLHRRHRVARDDLARPRELDARQLRGVLVERLGAERDARRDHADEVLTSRRHEYITPTGYDI